MDPREREDSSSYVSQPQPHQESLQPVRQEEPLRRKKSRAAVILALLFVLALVAAAALGWLWYQQNGRVGNLEADLSKSRNDVARLESAAKAEKQISTSEAVTTDTQSGDDELMKAALAFAKSGVKTGEVTATIGKKIGNFAYINIGGTQGTGYYIIFKKVNEIWVPILHGNGDQTKEMLDYYGVPDELIKS